MKMDRPTKRIRIETARPVPMDIDTRYKRKANVLEPESRKRKADAMVIDFPMPDLVRSVAMEN